MNFLFSSNEGKDPEVLNELTQQTLDESHSLLIQFSPAAAKVLVSIIKDQKIKAYSKIEAVKTLFQIIDKGVIDRQQAEQLNELKEMVNALEGNNKVIEVN